MYTGDNVKSRISPQVQLSKSNLEWEIWSEVEKLILIILISKILITSFFLLEMKKHMLSKLHFITKMKISKLFFNTKYHFTINNTTWQI